MNPEVIRIGKDGTSREVWHFDWPSWGSGVRLAYYVTEEKHPPQRKWRHTGYWSRYDHRSDTIKTPPLPDDVVAEVKAQLKEAIDKLEVKV